MASIYDLIRENNTSFDFDIEDFKQKVLSSKSIDSPIAHFDKSQWRISLLIKNPIEIDLQCMSTKKVSQRIAISCKFSIMCRNEWKEVTSFRRMYGNDFAPFGHSLGPNRNLFEKDTLLDPLNGYIKDNTVRLRVQIITLPATFGTPSLMDTQSRIKEDISLVVDGKNIRAHRVVLARGSDILEKMLYPESKKEIQLDDCDYKSTLTAVRFLYSKECVVDSKNLRGVLFIAKRLNLIGLMLSCFELLSPENAASFFLFMNVFAHSKRYTNFYWTYVAKNISQVLGSDDFWSLTDKEILSFIETAEVKSKANLVALKSIRRAIKNKKSNRRESKSFLCVICRENTVDTMVIPCNHLSLCSEDAFRLQGMNTKKCPLCQEEIQSFMKVFLP